LVFKERSVRFLKNKGITRKNGTIAIQLSEIKTNTWANFKKNDRSLKLRKPQALKNVESCVFSTFRKMMDGEALLKT